MDATDRLIQFWYVTLPKVLSRLMPRLASAVSDGGWMAAWRATAAWAPVIVFVAGCVVPRSWPGAHDIYTESLLFLAMAVSLSIFSGTWGVALLMANGVREALSRDVASTLAAVTHVGAGQLLAWLLLGVLVVVLPQFAHVVTEAAITRLRFLKHADARAVVRSLLLALVYAAVVLVWCLAAPVLLQPVFTWSGRPSSVESVAVLTESWKWLLAAAAGAALARGLFEGVVAPRAWLAPHAAAVMRERHEAMGTAGAAWDEVPDVARSALAGAGVGLLLSGLSQRLADGLAAGVVFGLLSFVARRPRGWLTGGWSDAVRIVPGAIRVGLALGFGYLAADRMPTLGLSGLAERSTLIGAALTLALFALFFPADHERLRPSRARRSMGPRGAGDGPRAHR